MSFYSLVIEFPPHIQKKLAIVCFGLAQVQWVEENNFYLPLRQLGDLSSDQLEKIKERLAHLFFSPFSLMISTINVDQQKSKGMIWAGAGPSLEAKALIKEIESLLKGSSITLPPFSPILKAPLGYFNKISSERLYNYILQYADFQLDPFEVVNCSLVCLKRTTKTIYYEVIASFAASSQAYGED
ncbi:MAG: hypothetical protein H0V82_07470 [Candidatus Protochlamydia sp.]|nr:hypothetical protein [Candidatus Protochlamydia sp.]